MTHEADSNHGYVTVVFNSIRPYAYEVNNILAVPNEFSYRFRFRHKWMSTIDNPMDLTGREGLIILRKFDTAEFVPLRRIKISAVLEMGAFFYIEYVLGDIVDFDSDETTRKGQLTEFNERMKPAVTGFKNKPGKDLDKLIFMYSDLAYGIKDEHFDGLEHNRVLNSWGNLIQILASMSCFTDFDFLKLLQIVDSAGGAAPVIGYPHPDTARLHLKSNTAYRAQVFQRTFTYREGDSGVISSRQLVLHGEAGEVRSIRSTYSIAGKYDLYQCYFKTEPVSWTRSSSLYLEIRRKDDIILPNIDIPNLDKPEPNRVEFAC